MKLRETRDLISNWIKTYAEKNNIQTLVVGVSGGIDSALTSTLCALTGLKTIVLSMPIHQKKKEINNIKTHVDWLLKSYQMIEFKTIDLTRIFEQYKSIIPLQFQSELNSSH